jgi:hypothetical protein
MTFYTPIYRNDSFLNPNIHVKVHRAYTASSLDPQVDLDRALHQALQIEGPHCGPESDHLRSGVFVSMFLMPDIKDVIMVPQVT